MLHTRPIELDDNHDLSALKNILPTPDTVWVEASTVKVGDELLNDSTTYEVVRIELANQLRDELIIHCEPQWMFALSPTSEVQRLVRGGTANVVLDQEVSIPKWLRTFSVLPIAVVASQIADVVNAEDRQRLPTCLNDCSIDNVGRLEHPARDAHQLSGTAWTQIAGRAPQSTDAPANISSWIQGSRASIDFRTMRRGDDRVVFAGVSTRYQCLDVDKIAGVVAAALPESAVAEYKYNDDGGRWSITCSLTRDWLINIPGRGSERHVPQIVVRGSDDGTRSLQVQFRALRWACTNGQVLGHSAVGRRVVHVGETEKVLESVVEALRGVDDDLEAFSAKWARAYGTMWRGAVGEGRAEQIDGLEALRRLCAHGLLPTGGRRRHTVWNQYKEAFEAEPGDSLAHVVNAVTRFAHEGAVTSSKQWSPSTWAREDIEDQVERVYVHVMRVLPAIDQDLVHQFA